MKDAGRLLRYALAAPVEKLSKENLIHAWCAVAYLFPGLHPDGYDDADSGWPRILRRFAAEVWRRAVKNEMADDELYASDAQWCGLYDRMTIHTREETERRVKLAAAFGKLVV
ncbi:MAG: hypothetical protein JWQ71_3666 [Pedosphaera sp.]|nr:hypothetical protein [Pedosphaera sp.]